MAAIISLAIGNNSLLGFESASAQLQSLAEHSAPLPLQYPSSQEIQTRCVEMLARLTHSPAPKGKAVGTSAIGRWAFIEAQHCNLLGCGWAVFPRQTASMVVSMISRLHSERTGWSWLSAPAALALCTHLRS